MALFKAAPSADLTTLRIKMNTKTVLQCTEDKMNATKPCNGYF